MIPQFIDHVVIMIKEMGQTQQFYSTFLGEPIFADDHQLAYQIGETKLFLIVASSWEATDKDKSGMNHLAFGVRTIDELKALGEILNNSGIKNSGVKIDKHGKKEYIWFDDPSNIRLEFYCRPNTDK